MVLLVCVDDQFGMMFNRRRQSSDSVVTAKILEMTAGKRLWMNNYSRSLFPENAPICVDDDFLKKASEEDYCFVENCDVKPYIGCAEKIVLFHWNRQYPADIRFPNDLLTGDWSIIHTLDFPGNSHKTVTVEVYSR